MAPTSITMLRQLHATGTLTKEAAVRIAVRRERLLRTELEKVADDFFGLIKEGGFFSRAGEALSKGEEVAAHTQAGGGFFGKFRNAGLTPGAAPGKTPMWSDLGANLAKMVGIAGLTAGATAGISGLVRHSNDKKLGAQVEQSFGQMLAQNEVLADEYQKDKANVDRYFGILAKYAPSLAANPTVAGSFVKTHLDMGQVEPNTVKQLVETQNRIDEMTQGRSPFTDHFDRGLTMATRAMNPSAPAKP